MPMDSAYDTPKGGLPHSDIHGSTPARGSPWLFAACHVLHRLLVPRHPPNALIILDTCLRTFVRRHTMHRNHPQTASGSRPRHPKTVPAGTCFAHNRILPDRRSNACSRSHHITNQTVSFTRL